MSRKEIDKLIESLEKKINTYNAFAIWYQDKLYTELAIELGKTLQNLQTLKAQQNVKKTKLL